MAKRRKKRPLRPRVPSRVKKRTRKDRVRSARDTDEAILGIVDPYGVGLQAIGGLDGLTVEESK